MTEDSAFNLSEWFTSWFGESSWEAKTPKGPSRNHLHRTDARMSNLQGKIIQRIISEANVMRH
jgi:hypothetical protein